MKVLGMIKEAYMKQTCTGENLDFKYGEVESERHRLYLEDSGQLYELLLYTEESPCSSGWCVSEYGIVELKEIGTLPDGMLKSRIDKEFDMVKEDMKRYDCDLFEFDVYGDDEYYPMGSYSVNEALFSRDPE